MADPVAARQKTQVSTPAELAAAREARGMGQVDISHRIKLQIKQVNALEQGQWEALPGRAFVRGALRSYGRLLDVDVAPLLESIGGFGEPAPVHALRPLDASLSRSSGNGFDGGGRGSTVPRVLACLAAVVALVLYFGSDPDSARLRSWLPSTNMPSGESSGPGVAETTPDRGQPTRPAPLDHPSSTGQTAASPVRGENAASDPGAAAAPPSVPSTPQVLADKGPSSGAGQGLSVSSLDTGAAAGTNGVPAPANGPDRGAPSSAAAADNRKVMQFKANEDSWIEVRQADGTALHNALLKAGSSIELKGTPPYRLVLGNAGRLELSYEGKAQDLVPHLRASNIARLQLQ